jgi:hypothetical protein
MKKLVSHFLQFLIVLSLFLLVSCGSGDDFSDKNTFNLDTLYASPDHGISSDFQLIWEVSIEGFPQFLIDVYLSEDEFLDGGDIKIAETADTDITTSPDLPYVNGLNFRMSQEGVAGIKFEFSHDQITWETGTTIQEVLSGKTKYFIGRFHHVQGMQVEVGRTRMAVEVAFE